MSRPLSLFARPRSALPGCPNMGHMPPNPSLTFRLLGESLWNQQDSRHGRVRLGIVVNKLLRPTCGGQPHMLKVRREFSSQFRGLGSRPRLWQPPARRSAATLLTNAATLLTNREKRGRPPATAPSRNCELFSSGRCPAYTDPEPEARCSRPASCSTGSAWRRSCPGAAGQPSRPAPWAAHRPSSRTCLDW
jgi:hypothetical protein